MTYNWQSAEWPNFRYSDAAFQEDLLNYAQCSGQLHGIVLALSEENQSKALLDVLVMEALKTSQIEGELLQRKDVVASVQKNLGLAAGNKPLVDHRAKGISEVIARVRDGLQSPLTEGMILDWHKTLMQHDPSVQPGKWRSKREPMQVVSGAVGRERIHFEAPPSSLVPEAMAGFITWFNETAPGGRSAMIHAPIRAAIAHLYFESIHPFADGNGRMGRAIAERALAQTTGFQPLFSLSLAIEAKKKSYYKHLESAQQSMEITEWVGYFLKTILEAQVKGLEMVEFTLKKTRFFDAHKDQLNEHQRKVVAKMFAAGSTGFKGGMNAEKYMRITKVSKATATRHLQELVALGAFLRSGAGRSTRYDLLLS